jgi:hypothetical protein
MRTVGGTNRKAPEHDTQGWSTTRMPGGSKKPLTGGDGGSSTGELQYPVSSQCYYLLLASCTFLNLCELRMRVLMICWQTLDRSSSELQNLFTADQTFCSLSKQIIFAINLQVFILNILKFTTKKDDKTTQIITSIAEIIIHYTVYVQDE